MNDAERSEALEAGRRAGLGYTMQRPRQTPAGLLGEQLGGGAGQSIEFMDYREYEPGDVLRRLDWNVYGRSDRLVVKLHREEVSPHCDVVVDASGSMSVEGTAKGAATLGLVAALAAACDNARMTRRVFTAGGGDGERMEPVPGVRGTWRGGAGRRRKRRRPGTGRLAGEALHSGASSASGGLRRRGVRVLISDLLVADDPWAVVSRLGRDASAVYVLQVLARQDADPRWAGDLRLVDRETGACGRCGSTRRRCGGTTIGWTACASSGGRRVDGSGGR